MQNEPRIFISHSSEDSPLAREIEADLRKAGVEVWVDDRSIRAGDNLPDEISKALSWCNTLLLVWSKTSAESFWVNLEWTNALTLQKRIIPLLLDETPLPPILSHRIYVKSLNTQERRSELLRALSGLRGSEFLAASPSRDDTHPQKVGVGWKSSLQTPKMSLTRKQWGFLLIGLTLAIVLFVGIQIKDRFFGGLEKSPVSASGSLITPGGNINPRQRRKAMLVIVDFSPSLSLAQREQVSTFANQILTHAAPASYSIYQLQPDWDRPTVLDTGEVQAASTDAKLQEEERLKRMDVAAKAPARSLGNASCIIDSLPFAQRFFRRYDPNEYQYELIYLSDMLEDCESRLLGQKIILTNSVTQFPKNIDFREKVDLSTVRITVVVPAARIDQKLPPLQNLQMLWTRIFSQCGLPDHFFRDQERFHFSSLVPDRFN